MPLDPMAAMAQNIASNFSANLRMIRRRRHLTQVQLSTLCGMPRSTLAQLETNGCNPTLTVLSRIALALQISVEELLAKPKARCQLFRKGSLPSRSRGRATKAIVQRLLPDPIPGMEIDRIELQPGARLPGATHKPGTREYLTCERGRFILQAADERYELETGDVAVFQGDLLHSYQNDSDSVAVGFCVVTLAPMPGAVSG